jgi:hypothetical protein
MKPIFNGRTIAILNFICAGFVLAAQTMIWFGHGVKFDATFFANIIMAASNIYLGVLCYKVYRLEQQ